MAVRFKQRHKVRFTNNRMRVLRAERHWSQDQLADRMGLQSKYRVWQLEQELTEPTPAEKKQLARIFRCTVPQIFPPPLMRRRKLARAS